MHAQYSGQWESGSDVALLRLPIELQENYQSDTCTFCSMGSFVDTDEFLANVYKEKVKKIYGYPVGEYALCNWSYKLCSWSSKIYLNPFGSSFDDLNLMRIVCNVFKVSRDTFKTLQRVE